MRSKSYTMESVYISDQELRIWCAEQCHDSNGELNLDKMKALYEWMTSRSDKAEVH